LTGGRNAQPDNRESQYRKNADYAGKTWIAWHGIYPGGKDMGDPAICGVLLMYSELRCGGIQKENVPVS